MKHKHVIGALPLLASILGRKYGVEVRIGGDSAHTNGRVIQLPGLPLDCDDTLLGLVRGYLDHEAAHIRETDFHRLKAANLSPLEMHIFNIFEDYRVENRLSAVYPGCRVNFDWLIRHLFMPKDKPKSTDVIADAEPSDQADPASNILSWLLLTARTWNLPELSEERDLLRAKSEMHFPGLSHELEPTLRQAPSRCLDTLETIRLAREITDIVRKYAYFMQQKLEQPSEPESEASDNTEEDRKKREYAFQSLDKLLSAQEGDLPSALGSILNAALNDACRSGKGQVQVAVPTGKQTRPLSDAELEETRQATIALRTRLQGFLQSTHSQRNRSGHSGRLDTRNLHKLKTGSAKLFLRKGERTGMNTAVHILLDTSSSMDGNKLPLAARACFAVASALHGIKGISLGVTAFPGNATAGGNDCPGHWNTVAPILSPGARLHSCFGMTPAGGTPLDCALWWILQQLHPRPERRKLVLIISDGEPDNQASARCAIAALKSHGLELYGIGIGSAAINKLLPEQCSRYIENIHDLSPAMFGILQNTLTGQKEQTA